MITRLRDSTEAGHILFCFPSSGGATSTCHQRITNALNTKHSQPLERKENLTHSNLQSSSKSLVRLEALSGEISRVVDSGMIRLTGLISGPIRRGRLVGGKLGVEPGAFVLSCIKLSFTTILSGIDKLIFCISDMTGKTGHVFLY